MPKYKITAPDGTAYNVESDSIEQATQDLEAHRQQEANKTYQTQFEQAPWWGKLGKAADDTVRSMANVVTGNYADKFADYMAGTQGQPGISGEEQIKTRAARERAGLAAPATDVVTAAAMIPTLAPKAIAAMGGGPAARVITGAGVSGAEGATIGGVSAAGADKDVGTGAAIGGVTGILGSAAGDLVNKGTRTFNEMFRGKVYDAPKYNISKVPSNVAEPDKQMMVNIAAGQTGSKARLMDDPIAVQRAQRQAFEELQSSVPKKTFTPAEHAQLDKIISGDPATTLTRMGGKTLTDKLGVGAVGTGAGFATGNPIIGALAGGGMLAAGRGLKEISAGGTKEAIQDLRRMMYGVDKFKGPVSDEAKARFAATLRQLGLEDTE